jgi:hypothetical protein
MPGAFAWGAGRVKRPHPFPASSQSRPVGGEGARRIGQKARRVAALPWVAVGGDAVRWRRFPLCALAGAGNHFGPVIGIPYRSEGSKVRLTEGVKTIPAGRIGIRSADPWLSPSIAGKLVERSGQGERIDASLIAGVEADEFLQDIQEIGRRQSEQGAENVQNRSHFLSLPHPSCSKAGDNLPPPFIAESIPLPNLDLNAAGRGPQVNHEPRYCRQFGIDHLIAVITAQNRRDAFRAEGVRNAAFHVWDCALRHLREDWGAPLDFL